MQHVAQIADTVAGKVTTHDYTILFGNIQSLYEFNRWNSQRVKIFSGIRDFLRVTSATGLAVSQDAFIFWSNSTEMSTW